MKIGSTRLTNTHQGLLDLVRMGPGISAAYLVALVYPESKQPEKKCRTFTRHLRRLQRLGLVRQIGNGWYPTRGGAPSGGGGHAA